MRLPRFLEMNPPSHKTIDWAGPLMLIVAGCVFFYFLLRSHYSIDWALAGQALAVAIPLAIVAYALWATSRDFRSDMANDRVICAQLAVRRRQLVKQESEEATLDEPTTGECDADDSLPESVSEYIKRRNGNNPWRDREFDE